MTLVKSRAASFGIDPALFEKSDIHIHVLREPLRKMAQARAWPCSRRWSRF